MASLELELGQAKRFYKRAQRERDQREMRRQAREIDHLTRQLIRRDNNRRAMGVVA